MLKVLDKCVTENMLTLTLSQCADAINGKKSMHRKS